ncbi:TPA: cell envelope integrity protein TolA [Vibrio parahaemolyticus]|uniref:cell envelope integrity protein TolA n=1 Tax=Vibrio parahaemolyticus TaxID=670 RepID=UPI001D16EB2E|nr:cell envelope integrity protein TolA [Vibrio parahaemolyticus]MCC3856413.1 cell envelope integrity protein TolA [Vibrio parahaemolyticus]MCI9685380.1 cell envelope integrity protein TolA [Vibrio parahaemolyticus]HCE1480266.1 cell envelope integrity protein TolA [Vibrio parahaemolyticus]HCH1559773.1 cell envelope integrity protein TolA [Vibrio parahaemolyticus]
MKDKKKQSKEYTKPIVISVGLHALLVAALLWGTDFAMTKPEPTGQMVQAVVIDPKLVQQQAKEIRQQREKAAKKEQDRLDKLRREAEQLEKNRKAEEEQIRKLKEQQAKDAKAAREAEAARKQKEQERKAEEERVRQEKERAAKLEKERKAKEEAVRKAEQERLAKEAAIAKAEQERIAKEKAAKEAAEKARKEKERLERLERERKEQEAALDDIFAGLESEASANQQAQGKFVADEVSRYSSIYIQLIQSRLLKDDYLLGKECRVNIKLIPTGTDMIVSSVNVLSGDSRVCAAAKSAIAQVPSFPMSTDSTVNQRLKDINLTVALQQ